MVIKYFKPSTPGQRGKVLVKSDEIQKKNKPQKSLTKGKKRISARDNNGRISVRRRGGGSKKKYREIDFKRDIIGIEGTVKAIEYDPNRSSSIALIVYKNGEKRYILATENMRVGDSILNGEDIKSIEGNCLPLKNIFVGSFVHNIEMQPGRGGQIVRSAGGYAKLLGKDGKYVTLEMPSGEVRLILASCHATIGVVSNKEKRNENSGKAGRSRWLGKRSKVRGVVMNPVDHPMGGGEGRSSGGRHPCSPTGVLAKGYKTRKKKKYSDKLIIRKRKN